MFDRLFHSWRPLPLSVWLCVTVAFISMPACKKETEEPVPDGGSGAPGTPNSIVTFTQSGQVTTMANWACLDGTELTIRCRKSSNQGLYMRIDNYTGPGQYIVGPEATVIYSWNEASGQSGYYSDIDSCGYITITNFNPAGSLSGSFEFTVTNVGLFSDGTFDQVRAMCEYPDSTLKYTISTLVPGNHNGYIDENSTSFFDIRRTADQIVVTEANGAYLSPGSVNVFTFTMPIDIAVGSYSGNDAGGVSMSYSRPGEAMLYDANDPNNELVVTTHETIARRVKGTFSVAMSSGKMAVGYFDLLY